MTLVSFVGYALFPLSADKLALNFQNIMHMVVTIIVMITTIASIIIIGWEYLKKDKLVLLGKISLIAASLIIIFGFLSPVAMELNIFGITQRIVIFTLHIFIFFVSAVYTFDLKKFLGETI